VRVEDSRPFDAELDFDHQRRNRPPPPPPLTASRPRRGGRGPRPPRRSRSETFARVAWALPWIAIAVTIIIVGGPVFAAAMIAFAWIGLSELFRMTREARPFVAVALVASAALVVAAYYGTHFQLVIVIAAIFPAMFAASVFRPAREGVTVAMAVTLFGVVWIGVPFAHAVLLRELPDHGAALLVDVLVATFVSDTAAYAGGRMFGRHRLAPALSPNKTL
jgi:phosphatidate cytidylyltransferase